MSLKKLLILCTALSCILFFKYLPCPDGLSQSGMQVLGIFFGCLLLWLTISIDWASILGILAIAFMPVMQFKTVVGQAFGSETFLFLLFTFICTYPLSETPFLRRCAIAIITGHFAKKGGWHFIASFFTSVLVIGLFISPTVLFVIFLPIHEQLCRVLNLKKGSRIAEVLMIGMVFSTGLSAGMTPISHVFSIMAMGFYERATGISIDYAAYMLVAIPTGILSFLLMLLVFKFVYKLDISSIKTIDVSQLKDSLPKITLEEKIALTVFFAMIALWVLPSILKSIFPATSLFILSFGTAMPPMLASLVLAMIPIKSKPILSIPKALASGIPWASLLMTAATLTIGAAMTNSDVGLSAFLVNSLSATIHGINPLLLMIIFVVWAAVQTNLSSNMVTVTLVTTTAIPLCLAGNSVNTAAICVLIGMSASFAFAAPCAMPYVALAGSSGWTSPQRLFFYGLMQMFICIAVTILVAYPIASAIL